MMRWLSLLQKNSSVIIASVAVTLVAVIVLLGVFGVVAFTYRAELFDYFAGEYVDRISQTATATSTKSGDNLTNVLSLDSQITGAVEKASPAVVSVIASKEVPVIERYYEEYSPFGGGFGFRVPQFRQKGTEKQQVGGGTGFFVSADGLIVTNRHVVSDSDADYTVLTNDGKKHDVTVVAKDTFLDIAVLRLADASASKYPHLTFANSDAIQPGQFVIAIGNALGEFRNSVSAGVISGLSRNIVAGSPTGQSEQLDHVIQTDAAINPGNSGGPLLNTQGKVVGVNVAVARGSENIGFALPANEVKRIVNSVKEHGEIVRPYLGVRYTMITEQIAEANNLSVNEGALIIRGNRTEQLAVVPGSPADKAGIVENDIILEVNGTDVTQEKPLSELIQQYTPGAEVTLRVLHRGERKTVTVTLEEAPNDM